MNFDSSVLQVPIEDIIPNRFQPRLSFDDAGLKDLAASIKQYGIIQPLVLRRVGDKYEIIAGERRYKAATMAGLASIPAVVSQLDDQKSAEVAVAENVQRSQLSAIEEAKSYKALLDLGYMSQDMLAKKMGISQGALSNKLRLLNLCEEVQNAVMENQISERHARSLLSLKDSTDQIRWKNKIINERLTVRQLDLLLKEELDQLKENNIEPVNVQQITKEGDEVQVVNEIPVNEPIQVDNSMNNTFISNEPIELGETQNKFIKSLEDESVNMQTGNDTSIFTAPSFNIPSTPVETAPVVNTPLASSDEIDSLDVLDFSPEPSSTTIESPSSQYNLDYALNKINDLVNELGLNFEVNKIHTINGNEMSVSLSIKEKN